jgi:hypothetical protein
MPGIRNPAMLGLTRICLLRILHAQAGQAGTKKISRKIYLLAVYSPPACRTHFPGLSGSERYTHDRERFGLKRAEVGGMPYSVSHEANLFCGR